MNGKSLLRFSLFTACFPMLCSFAGCGPSYPEGREYSYADIVRRLYDMEWLSYMPQ